MKAQRLHPLQESILRLAQHKNLAKLSLRAIGKFVGDDSPQKIKHHLQQLEKRGLLKIDRRKKFTSQMMHGSIEGFLKKGKRLLRIPIVGAANCGPAELLAEQNIIGYLRVSDSLLGRKSSKGLFAVRATGFSMNQAKIQGKKIEDGDYIVVDGDDRVPRQGDITLSIIDGAANIKRYHLDKRNHQVVLMSDSIDDVAPIHIHPDDDFFVNGKVIDVIKKPSLR